MPNEPTDFEIKHATNDDAAGIASIYAHYVAAKNATFDTEAWTSAQTEKLVSCNPPEVFWVARKTRVLGWASARRFSVRPGYKHSLESAVYVDPECCGLGIGTQLMKQLFEHCTNSGIHHLMAKIIADNRASLDFHERLGFETVGKQLEVGRVDGRWVDIIILQKLLERRPPGE